MVLLTDYNIDVYGFDDTLQIRYLWFDSNLLTHLRYLWFLTAFLLFQLSMVFMAEYNLDVYGFEGNLQIIHQCFDGNLLI
jgi:hypothetical protein